MLSRGKSTSRMLRSMQCTCKAGLCQYPHGADDGRPLRAGLAKRFVAKATFKPGPGHPLSQLALLATTLYQLLKLIVRGGTLQDGTNSIHVNGHHVYFKYFYPIFLALRWLTWWGCFLSSTLPPPPTYKAFGRPRTTKDSWS